jgi:hypothetical protein
MATFPKIFKIRQKAKAPKLRDVERELKRKLEGFEPIRSIRQGERVGLTAGSRGIKDKFKVLKVLVGHLKAIGASPYLVPCMGSHGGGTAEGQIDVLKNLGIMEESIGAPILSSMDVEEIGRTRLGFPVLVDKHLCQADKIIVVNRIKPHTDFKGDIESGLVKMMVIGMGKHQGAFMAHQLTIKHGFPAVLSEISSVILEKLPIWFGVGIVENQYDETAFVELFRPEELVEKEKVLLKKARKLMPGLPFDQMDVLIVDELGKNISGGGMDTNVIGRLSFIGSPKPKKPRITRIFVRDLSKATHGNATGIGMADFTTMRLVDKIDHPATQINCITSMAPEDSRIPISFETDREAISAAFKTSGVLNVEDLRLVWIKNTLELEYLFASQALLEEVRANPRLEVVGELSVLPFSQNGNLVPIWNP